MKTHHKLKSLDFINHNTSCLDIYKVICTVYRFPKELTHTPSGTCLHPQGTYESTNLQAESLYKPGMHMIKVKLSIQPLTWKTVAQGHSKGYRLAAIWFIPTEYEWYSPFKTKLNYYCVCTLSLLRLPWILSLHYSLLLPKSLACLPLLVRSQQQTKIQFYQSSVWGNHWVT